MEKLSPIPVEIVADDTGETNEAPEKPDFVKKIESFDLNNLSPENIEFMNHTIQDIFREHFPVDGELIDKIPDHMKIVDDEEFMRLRQETKEDADMDLGFYSLKLDQMLINVSKHRTPGALFSTMFHEALHFTSIQSGAGLSGGFCYPGLGENETDGLMSELDDGVCAMVEGTTQNITHAYVVDYLGFDPQPQMFSYEPEYQITNAIWEPFSKEERMQAYFNTPLELLRIRVESAFEEDYDPDKPTGIFADCLVGVARAAKQMGAALDSWRKSDNPELVEDVLKNVRHAVGLFVIRELEDGRRALSGEDEDYLHDYLEPYLTEE